MAEIANILQADTPSGSSQVFALLELKEFLIRLGRETNQGEVGVVIDGIYYGFTQF